MWRVTYWLCTHHGLAASFGAHPGKGTEEVVGEDVDALETTALGRVEGRGTGRGREQVPTR